MRIISTLRKGAAAAVVGVLLSGCTTPAAPSRPMAAAEAAVSEIPGATFQADRARNGTTAYVNATLSVTDAFAGDPAALLDYSLAQLASQDEVDRGQFVRLTFDGPGQTPEKTKTLLVSLRINSEQYGGGSSLELANQDLDERYGTWPASPPSLPPSLHSAR